MRIQDIPTKDHPREKLIQHGARALSDAELLAIVLRHGSRVETALQMSYRILSHCDHLTNLLHLPHTEFTAIPGLGNSHFCQLHAALEMYQRTLYQPLRNTSIFHEPTQLQAFLLAQLRHQTEETFCCLFLNQHYHAIAFEKLFTGTINKAYVHPRMIIKRAFFHNAAAIVLAHNHPSGNPTPSSHDWQLTDDLSNLLEKLDIQLIDHYIIGGNRVISCTKYTPT